MPFKEVPRRYDFPAAERSVIEFWKANDVFRKSIDIRGKRTCVVDGLGVGETYMFLAVDDD